MRRDPESYTDGEEVELVHLARKLRVAKAVEALLDELGLDYVARTAPYRTTTLFIPTTQVGVQFWVSPDHAERCRRLLEERRLPGVIRREPET